MGYHVFTKGIGMQEDSSRYVSMALNLLEYGVISPQIYDPGASPAPGMVPGGLFTAFELSVAAALDDGTRAGMLCLLKDPASQTCGSLTSLKIIYTAEIAVFLVCLYLLARQVFGGWIRPSLVILLALGMRDLRSYSHDVLSEPSYLAALGLFFLAWLAAVRSNGAVWRWGVVGLAVGVLVHVKPAWSALVPAMLPVFILMALWQRDRVQRWRDWGLCWAALAAGWGVLMLPVLIRNGVSLGYWGLSDDSYLLTTLSHRFAYNAMPWTEFFAGFLYYLPDFGDNAARALFGPETAGHLSWDPQGYYVYGRDILHRIALGKGTVAEAKAYLFHDHFFNDPLKSFAVTLLMVWRGLFVGHLFGLVALVLFLPVVWMSSRRIRMDLGSLLLPVLLMAGVHAIVSVSIPRYNLGLLVLYCFVLTQVLCGLWSAGSRLIAKTAEPSGSEGKA